MLPKVLLVSSDQLTVLKALYIAVGLLLPVVVVVGDDGGGVTLALEQPW